MTDYRTMERQFVDNLRLDRRPVAITFCSTAPTGVAKFSGEAPSGCSFWRMASDGRTFYTIASQHYNCPIGSYTHNIPLPPERADELNETLSLMASIGYVRMEEVPNIPRLSQTPEAIVYAPLADTPTDPDVVLFCGRPTRMMLLEEAAIRAGVSSHLNTLARPTCMALPASLTRGMVGSTGCIGNRVYTGLDDAELYVAIAGRDVGRIAEQAHTIADANNKLLAYHEDRRAKLTASEGSRRECHANGRLEHHVETSVEVDGK
jgi:uncharacterized protein (DUF169 family)